LGRLMSVPMDTEPTLQHTQYNKFHITVTTVTHPHSTECVSSEKRCICPLVLVTATQILANNTLHLTANCLPIPIDSKCDYCRPYGCRRARGNRGGGRKREGMKRGGKGCPLQCVHSAFLVCEY